MAVRKTVQKEARLIRTAAVTAEALAIVRFPGHFVGAVKTVSACWLGAAAQCITAAG